MLQHLKRSWRQFRQGRPGHRFQDNYERGRRERKTKPLFLILVKPALGIVLIVVGIFFLFVPGPGLPLILMGCGFMAYQFRLLAVALDWSELRIRIWMKWCHNLWRHLVGVLKPSR